MYHPTTRLLTILELLQTHGMINGAELASRLEVDRRTVRKYMMMLQDLGIPIETTRGPHGGYQLRPGFKLPPLMFNEEEATALVLGLLGTSWLTLTIPSIAVEGALAKLLRVLPTQARERLSAVSTHLTLSPHEQGAQPDALQLIALSEAIQMQYQVYLVYQAQNEQLTERVVDPYSLTGWWGGWYLAAYCHLRCDYRLFRLDRIVEMERLMRTFERVEAFDSQKFTTERLTQADNAYSIKVEFQAPIETVQQRVHPNYGTFQSTEKGVLFEAQYGHLPSVARYLMGLDLPFVVHEPQELRSALLDLAKQITQNAAAPSAT